MLDLSQKTIEDHERDFTCPHCGHAGRVLIISEGSGDPSALSSQFGRDAATSASRAAFDNAEQLLHLRTCPRCRRRGSLSGHVFRAVARGLIGAVIGGLLALPLAFIALGMDERLLVPTFIVVVLGTAAFAYWKYEHWKLAEADRRVRFIGSGSTPPGR